MSGGNDPDLRAVASFQAGEDPEAAFRKLVDRHYRPILRLFLRRGVSRSDAHDLTQETFLRVYQGLSGFRGGARFETWLYRIALNTLDKDRRRLAATKRRAEVHALAIDEGRDGASVRGLRDPAPSPLESALADEHRAQLRAAIRALPPRMRACVRMRVEQQLGYQQIAEALQLSVETVKAHLYQARRRLTAALTQAEEEGG